MHTAEEHCFVPYASVSKTLVPKKIVFVPTSVTHPVPLWEKVLTHGRNDEIQLPIINSNVDIGFQQFIYSVDHMLHEVSSHIHEHILRLTYRAEREGEEGIWDNW